jgi:hypothetical protein
MPSARIALLVIVTLAVGVLSGGALFSRSQPRSFLSITNCAERCFSPKELAGLLFSAGIHFMPSLLPIAEQESAECVAVRHPKPEGRMHFVLFPKRDIRNILELEPQDQPFVMGCFALARELAGKHGVRNYRLLTNGPDLQHVSYLHFHLVAR